MKYLLKKLIHYADKAIACLILLAVILTMIPAGIYASESNSETPPENSIAEEESDFSPEQEESTSISPSASDDEELITEESTDGEETEIESDNEESSSDNPEEPSSEEIPTIEEAPSEELSPSESEESSTPPDESENEAQDDKEIEESSEPETSSEGSSDIPADPSESVEESVEESETETEAESTTEEMPPESTEPVESTEEPPKEETVVEEDPEPYTGYVDIDWGNAYAEAITVKVVEDGEPATKASNSGARLVKYTDTEKQIKPASTMELRYDNDYLRNVVPGWEDNAAYALFGPGDGGFPVKYIYDYNGYSYNTVAPNTVKSYMDYLADAFLFSECKRWDVKGKYYFDYPNKYYCEDIGLRNARIGLRQQEMTHIMENIIYNELIVRGYTVDVGIVYGIDTDKKGCSIQVPHEIDFVATIGGKRVYIQSAYVLPDDAKTEIESRPFGLTGDFFPKIIVRHDIRKHWYDDHGILNIGIIDFLLDQNVV